MSRLSLALGAVVVAALATFTPSLGVRAQSATRFEYVRLAPYMVQIQTSANAVQERWGYRACVAGNNDWRCREFPPADTTSGALRVALATLGDEGWDLVSTVHEEQMSGLTYLFKRQAR